MMARVGLSQAAGTLYWRIPAMVPPALPSARRDGVRDREVDDRRLIMISLQPTLAAMFPMETVGPMVFGTLIGRARLARVIKDVQLPRMTMTPATYARSYALEEAVKRLPHRRDAVPQLLRRRCGGPSAHRGM